MIFVLASGDLILWDGSVMGNRLGSLLPIPFFTYIVTINMTSVLKQHKKAYYGEFGGQFVPETLMSALEELEKAYEKFSRDKQCKAELAQHLRDFVGRPTPLYFAERLTKKAGGAKIYLKREDLTHTGAHKINNAVGQILLARFMGKKRIIAETGAGQHGVATAAAAAKFGLECVVYMGETDMERQKPNVLRMKLLGATVVPVSTGSKTLKDSVNEALRDWIANIATTHYLLGSVLGPHPYPLMIRNFQKVIGEEARREILKKEKRLPDYLVACVGGGSNAIGLFYPFLRDKNVKMVGVEAGVLALRRESTQLAFPEGRSASCMVRSRSFCKTGSDRYGIRTAFRPDSTIRASARNTVICGISKESSIPP